jgi:hypothetical protein
LIAYELLVFDVFMAEIESASAMNAMDFSADGGFRFGVLPLTPTLSRLRARE